MTGLTDSMRTDFRLMADVNKIIQRQAPDRLKDIVNFVKDMTSQRKVQELIKPWGLELECEPLKVTAQ